MRKSTSQSIEILALEPRVLFCGDHLPTLPMLEGGFGATHTTHAAHGPTSLDVPVLNSMIHANATIYLDFDGDTSSSWGVYSPGTTPAYDTDGNSATFTAGELANITEIWQRVAEKFSPFSINVTTVNPGTFADGKALHVVVGGGGGWTGVMCGGISYVGSFVNTMPNEVFAFSDNLGAGYPKYVAEAIAHESGHAFGLQHQSSFNKGAKLQEYFAGDANDAPIMGNSYGSTRGTWWNGTSSTGEMQDDMAVIASDTNGFGYKKDDYGSALSHPKGTRFNNGKFTIKGTLETITDRDVFQINFTGGSLQLKLRAAGAGSMLDGKLRLYRADGSTVFATDGAGLSETVTRTLPAGTYYAMVYGHVTTGDVGQYQMYVYSNPAAAPLPASAPVTHSLFSNSPISGQSITDLV